MVHEPPVPAARRRLKSISVRLHALGLLTAVLGFQPSAAAADATGAAALVDDAARLVASTEADGWFSDTEALRDVDGPMLESVCRATPDARSAADDELKRAAARAGDARRLFAASGKLDGAVKRALTAERRSLLLAHALARAATDCPFWVRPEPAFRGLQSDRKRFTLSFETEGNVQIRATEGEWTYGGGGDGRILPGYGFDGTHTLLAGVEFGGAALIRPHSSASQFVITYLPAVPIVFRTRTLLWQYDVEAAPIALFQADDTRPSFGFRVGAGLGLLGLRKRDFLPWAGLAASYEYYARGGDRAPAHFIVASVRVGLPWDP